MLKELAGQSHNAIAIVRAARSRPWSRSRMTARHKKTEAAAALKSLASNADFKGDIIAAGGLPRFSVGDHGRGRDRACVVQGVHGVDEGRYRYRVLFEDGGHEDVAEGLVRLAAGALVDADRGETERSAPRPSRPRATTATATT